MTDYSQYRKTMKEHRCTNCYWFDIIGTDLEDIVTCETDGDQELLGVDLMDVTPAIKLITIGCKRWEQGSEHYPGWTT